MPARSNYLELPRQRAYTQPLVGTAPASQPGDDGLTAVPARRRTQDYSPTRTSSSNLEFHTRTSIDIAVRPAPSSFAPRAGATADEAELYAVPAYQLALSRIDPLVRNMLHSMAGCDRPTVLGLFRQIGQVLTRVQNLHEELTFLAVRARMIDIVPTLTPGEIGALKYGATATKNNVDDMSIEEYRWVAYLAKFMVEDRLALAGLSTHPLGPVPPKF